MSKTVIGTHRKRRAGNCDRAIRSCSS